MSPVAGNIYERSLGEGWFAHMGGWLGASVVFCFLEKVPCRCYMCSQIYCSFNSILSSAIPFILLSMHPFFSVSRCLCASSQSVSKKCCCQLTFPITPRVAQTMDTLLTSGDRAERGQNLEWSARTISLTLPSFNSKIYLSIYLKCRIYSQK